MEFGFKEVDAKLSGKEMLWVGLACIAIALFIIFVGG